MPWTPKDAFRHTKKASTPALQQQWASIANEHLQKTGDEAAAIKIANEQIANHPSLKDKRKPNVKPGTPTPPNPGEGMAGPQPLSGLGPELEQD